MTREAALELQARVKELLCSNLNDRGKLHAIDVAVACATGGKEVLSYEPEYDLVCEAEDLRWQEWSERCSKRAT